MEHLVTFPELENENFGKTTDDKLICLHMRSIIGLWDVCSNPSASKPKAKWRCDHRTDDILAVVGISPESFITIHQGWRTNEVFHWRMPDEDVSDSRFRPEFLCRFETAFASVKKIIFLTQKKRIILLAKEDKAYTLYSLNIISDRLSLEKVVIEQLAHGAIQDFFSSQDENLLYILSTVQDDNSCFHYLSCLDINTLSPIYENALLKNNRSPHGICAAVLDEEFFAVAEQQQVVVYQCTETESPKHFFTLNVELNTHPRSMISDPQGGLLISDGSKIIRVVPDQKKLDEAKSSSDLSATVADALPRVSLDVCKIITNYARSHSLLFKSLHLPFPAEYQVYRVQQEKEKSVLTCMRG